MLLLRYFIFVSLQACRFNSKSPQLEIQWEINYFVMLIIYNDTNNADNRFLKNNYNRCYFSCCQLSCNSIGF